MDISNKEFNKAPKYICPSDPGSPHPNADFLQYLESASETKALTSDESYDLRMAFAYVLNEGFTEYFEPKSILDVMDIIEKAYEDYRRVMDANELRFEFLELNKLPRRDTETFDPICYQSIVNTRSLLNASVEMENYWGSTPYIFRACRKLGGNFWDHMELIRGIF